MPKENVFNLLFWKNYGLTKTGTWKNIRTESPIDTNFSVQYGDNSNFDGSEKNYLDVFIYINGSKIYPWKSSFIFHSKNVAVNNVNDLRLIFNRSHISTKRVYIKVPPCGLTTFEGWNNFIFVVVITKVFNIQILSKSMRGQIWNSPFA